MELCADSVALCLPFIDSRKLVRKLGLPECDVAHSSYSEYKNKLCALSLECGDLCGIGGKVIFGGEVTLSLGDGLVYLVEEGDTLRGIAEEFSTTEHLNEGDEYNRNYWNEVVIRIVRSSCELKNGFEYNTVIDIKNKDNNIRGSVYMDYFE